MAGGKSEVRRKFERRGEQRFCYNFKIDRGSVVGDSSEAGGIHD